MSEDSEAFVGYEKSSRQARFGSLRGVVEVVAGDVQRRLRSLEEVVQVGDRMGEPRPLPGRPEPAEPTDNAQFDSDKVRELVLAWGPVGGAARYALQVSRNHLFVDNVIDVDDRTKTRATLGLRGGGSFLWRVAAVVATAHWAVERATGVRGGGRRRRRRRRPRSSPGARRGHFVR